MAFTDSERLIGDSAKNQTAMNPMNTVFDAKRLIGRKFSEPQVQADIKDWSFTVEAGERVAPFCIVSCLKDQPLVRRRQGDVFRQRSCQLLLLGPSGHFSGVCFLGSGAGLEHGSHALADALASLGPQAERACEPIRCKA